MEELWDELQVFCKQRKHRLQSTNETRYRRCLVQPGTNGCVIMSRHMRLCFQVALHTHSFIIWAAPSEFGTYRLCVQRRFRRACASAQSRQNLRCSLIQAVNQEEPSDRKPDPCPLWMAGHAQLKFVMTEFSKTQIRLTRPIWRRCYSVDNVMS